MQTDATLEDRFPEIWSRPMYCQQCRLKSWACQSQLVSDIMTAITAYILGNRTTPSAGSFLKLKSIKASSNCQYDMIAASHIQAVVRNQDQSLRTMASYVKLVKKTDNRAQHLKVCAKTQPCSLHAPLTVYICSFLLCSKYQQLFILKQSLTKSHASHF